MLLPMSLSPKVVETVLCTVCWELLERTSDSEYVFPAVTSTCVLADPIDTVEASGPAAVNTELKSTSNTELAEEESVTVVVRLMVNGEEDPKVRYSVVSLRNPNIEFIPADPN